MYQQVPVSITGPQLKKLWQGHPVQLSADQLRQCTGMCKTHPLTAKKMHRAAMKGSGVRVQMSPEEIMMTGSGWGSDAWNWFKEKVPQAFNYLVENVPKAARYVKENVIDSPFYQEKIRPVIREKLEGLAESKPYANYTVPAIEYAGDYTGAFGVKGRRRPKPAAKGGRIVTRPQIKRSGGSFMV